VIVAVLAALLQITAGGGELAVPLDGGARSAAFAPDGRLAVEIRGDLWIASGPASGRASWTRLTSGVAWDRSPAWSPDGSYLVFASDRAGSFDLWRVAVSAAGVAGDAKRLTTDADQDGEPSVAADGSIVFARGRGVGSDIWIRSPDGKERRLTTQPGAERTPRLSPDGKTIAYVVARGATRRVHLLTLADGTDRALEADADYPAWSPSGDKLAYSSSAARPGVFVALSNGDAPVLATMRRGLPAWSPDAHTLLVMDLPPEPGPGSYNGDPDRLGDRDIGERHPAPSHVWLINATALPDSAGVEWAIPVTTTRTELNAEEYDRVVQRETRLYFSTPAASARRAAWERAAAEHRSRAVSAPSDSALDDAIWALERERPPLREPAAGRAAVSSAHPVATAAGLEALRKGGNVVDAAVAVSFALGVVEPDASGVGGYGQMLIYLRGMDRPTLIEFMTTVPALASITNPSYPPGGRFPPDGPLLANVPGTVAAMHLAWQKYGSKKVAWADLIAPAIRAAKNGYVVSDGLATTLSLERESYLKYSGSAKLFFRDGQPARAGDIIKNPDLAWTLSEIAKGGADALYRGPVGERLVADLGKAGHAMTMRDLDAYRAVEREPVAGTFRGNAVYSSAPPVAGGATLIAQLNALEQFASPVSYTEDAATLHAVIEAWVLAPRGATINDPDLWPVNVEPAVNKDSARTRWQCFDVARAVTPAMLTGDSSCARVRRGGSLAPSAPGTAGSGGFATLNPFAFLAPATPAVTVAVAAEGTRPERGSWTAECEDASSASPCRSTGTTAFAVADAAGNMVAATQTLGTWGGNFYVSPGLGFAYNDKVNSYRGGTDPTAPGARVAGARHGSTLAPTLVFHGSGVAMTPWFAVGAAGNAWITSAVYQTLVGIVDSKLDPQRALELPRFQTGGGGGRGGGAGGGYVVQIEDGVSPAVVRQLQAMGHRIQFISLPGEVRQGYGAAVTIDAAGVKAGGDPRRSGTAGSLPCRGKDDHACER
jgi:gamma-glutamyltranspeptidase